jgi:L-amino acid N-acyltransferase YncA
MEEASLTMQERSGSGNSRIFVADLRREDVPDIMPIIRHWVRKDGEVLEDEVESTVEVILESLSGSSGSHYLVAKDEQGKALGIMGYGAVNDRMRMFASGRGAASVGLLTAFLSPEARGRGVGGHLLSSLFDRAGASGASEMIWSSNPRYRETAWRFYTAMAGDPVGSIDDLFYAGSSSPVWRKTFSCPEGPEIR